MSVGSGACEGMQNKYIQSKSQKVTEKTLKTLTASIALLLIMNNRIAAHLHESNDSLRISGRLVGFNGRQ